MKKVFEYVLLTIGSIIVAGSLELILAPNGLVDGGVTAIVLLWRIKLQDCRFMECS